MRLVLGIDPGTATTGFGLVREHEDGSLEMVSLWHNPDLTSNGGAQAPDEVTSGNKRNTYFSTNQIPVRWRSYFSSAMSVQPSPWDRHVGWCMLAIAEAGLEMFSNTRPMK